MSSTLGRCRLCRLCCLHANLRAGDIEVDAKPISLSLLQFGNHRRLLLDNSLTLLILLNSHFICQFILRQPKQISPPDHCLFRFFLDTHLRS